MNLGTATYTLTNGVLNVSTTVTVRGQSGATVNGASRIFSIQGSGDLRLNTMTVQGGSVEESTGNGPMLGGGNILNQGRLTMQSVLIRDGYSDVQGGNIANYGSMSLTDGTVSGGGVQYVGGAGIYNAPGANATITRAGIRGNSNSHSGQGGGALNRGSMSIIDSTLQDNYSVNGSNVNNEGTLTIRGSTFIGNADDEFQPGGIANSGTLNDEGGNEIRS